jgi:hypothetical protein
VPPKRRDFTGSLISREGCNSSATDVQREAGRASVDLVIDTSQQIISSRVNEALSVHSGDVISIDGGTGW